MLAAFKRQISKDREEYKEHLVVQQRQIGDFQRRHVDDREDRLRHRVQQRQTGDFQRHQTDEDREDRLRQRENKARRQEATERDIEEERVRLRIDGMRLNRAIATLGRNIPLHKLKLPTLSPAQVYDQITSSMDEIEGTSFLLREAAAYATLARSSTRIT
jgi:hypothetical protein